MKHVFILILLSCFASCHSVKVFKQKDFIINGTYYLNNVQVQSAVEEIATKFGAKDATIVYTNDFLIIRGKSVRLTKVSNFLDQMKK